jgi:hypothetical protein
MWYIHVSVRECSQKTVHVHDACLICMQRVMKEEVHACMLLMLLPGEHQGDDCAKQHKHAIEPKGGEGEQPRQKTRNP